MPPRTRTKGHNTTPSHKKKKETASVMNQAKQPSQSQGKKHKSYRYTLLFIPILCLMALNSLVTFLYTRSLDPLYGSVAVKFHLDKIVWTATIMGAFGPVPSLRPSLVILGGLVTSIPVSLYWTAVYTGKIGNPVLGSTVTHLVVLFPVIYIGVSLVKHITVEFDAYISENSTARYTIIPACATSITEFPVIWNYLLESYRFGFSDSEILYIIGGIFVALYCTFPAFTSLSSPPRQGDKENEDQLSTSSRRLYGLELIVVILFALQWCLSPPLMPKPMREPYTHPIFPLRILSSVSSVTGVIVVGESLPSGSWMSDTSKRYSPTIRYLRASHSLLGGFWIGNQVSTRANSAPLLDAKGTPLGDPIFHAFVLQEAVRLVDTSDREIETGREKALFIGLGAGAAVTSFAMRDIDTTVIEIDPAVYNASRQYFGLPDLGSDRVFLQDARVVVSEKRRAALQYDVSNAERYDYVVHDCFTGDGMPPHLFTLQFWEDLKVIMNPDGVVAVNFAGKINSDPAKAILFTLQKSFGQCRVLHADRLDHPDLANTFLNLVFFCSPSTKSLSFRSPSEMDYAGSHSRAEIFNTLREREVDLKLIRGDAKDGETWVLRDTNNRLMDWQRSEALEHWRIMRSVFPELVWVTY